MKKELKWIARANYENGKAIHALNRKILKEADDARKEGEIEALKMAKALMGEGDLL